MGVCNAIWLVVLCVIQCSSVNSCHCNGSVLSRGANAFVVFSLTSEDVSGMTLPRIGGLIFSTGSVAIFFLFIAIFINTRLPQNEER